jgi:hypothetical protein
MIPSARRRFRGNLTSLPRTGEGLKLHAGKCIRGPGASYGTNRRMRIGDIAGLTLTLLCAAAPNSFAVETRDVPSFVETLTQYTNAADRPVLMLSRGTAIAWIPDPLHLPTNFNDYLSGDKQKLLPVSVGTAMVAFPPRGPQICRGGVLGVGQKCSPLPGTDRGMSSDFVLVLTADGLWGVLDRRRSVDVLNEDDLRRVATAEKSKPLARSL